MFLQDVAEYLAPLGLMYVQVDPNDPIVRIMFRVGGAVWHTIEGKSPRGGQHACVGCNGQLIHDPHPQDGTGRGLVTVECYGLLVARMDPLLIQG